MPATAMLPAMVVTRALRGVECGQPGAFEQVWRLVYQWVVQRAGQLLANDGLRFAISAEDLAHDAFLKVKPAHLARCVDRWHMIRLVARAMRQVLCDLGKRNGHAVAIDRDVDLAVVPAAADAAPGIGAPDLLDVAAALGELRHVNESLVDIAELRHFAGLTFDEVGAAFGRSEAWARARCQTADNWLRQWLRR